ncbi:uncharacterized protein G2W53_036614 [Senna tora]|uniref:Uncharacterized protein n=1 Tax=Senna tora TaxID=362788 RepID=A0A834W8W2_9FABA|nr:uncharacterized protein G2W53_036614 [Senna tora]
MKLYLEGRLQENGSASRAKTRSFPSASWLTLMISACEAKTKSYVYGQRVRRSWQRQGMEEMTIAFCHARSIHQLIKQAQRTVASMCEVNKAKKVRKDRVLRPYSNRRRATTLNLQPAKCKKPTQQDSIQGIFKSAEYAILLSLQSENNAQNDLQHLLIVVWRSVRARKKLDVAVAPSSNPSTHPLARPCCRFSHCARKDVRGKKEVRLLNEMTTSPSSTSSTS